MQISDVEELGACCVQLNLFALNEELPGYGIGKGC